MIVGIPRGLLYYEYEVMWKEFLKDLNIKYIVSPKTDKKIYENGSNYAIHEACLPLKIFLGHVDYLIDKCDCILAGRIGNFGFYDRVCTRYQSSIDLVENTFRDKKIKVLPFNIDYRQRDFELNSFVHMGKMLGKRKSKSIIAYRKARRVNDFIIEEKEKNLEKALKAEKTKILLVGHKYDVFDAYVGSIILDYLKEMDVEVIIATDMEAKKADFHSKEFTKTMPWSYNRQLLGTAARLRKEVDGIILLSSFNCGPDSMANEIIIRSIKELPILNLIVDGQEGIIGMETRLESFMDIISFKKEGGLF